MNKKTTRLFQTITILTISILALSFIPASAFSQDITYNSDWRMVVNGAVGKTLTLSINDLLAMPATTVHASLACYGNLLLEGDWTGVTLGQLISAAQVNAQENAIIFYFTASDTYTVTITSEDRPDWANIIIAYQVNGGALPEALRLVLPEDNGALWISMITTLTISLKTPDPVESPTSTPPQGGPGPIYNPTPAPTQAPTTEPENQTDTQPTIPPADSQALQQNDVSSTANFAVIGLIVITAFVLGIVGLLYWKSKKV